MHLRKKRTDEENPFDKPPDDDQAKVSNYFEPTSKQQEEATVRTPQKTTDDTNKSSSSGQSSPSPTKSSPGKSSTSSCPTRVACLGEFEEDGGLVENSPCIVQPDKVRSRIQMFSFPTRNIQRLEKHWGMSTVENLDKNLSDATVVSLYSGLGGAEIACSLTSHALASVFTHHAGGKTIEPVQPKYLLACDHASDCQKILRSHVDAYSSSWHCG